MTREEKQKAIDTLKISAPIMAVTQEEFNDYIQTINQVMDWLEQEPCDDCISREEALNIVHKYFEHYLQLNDDICLDGLRSLPSVTPQPKTGRRSEDAGGRRMTIKEIIQGLKFTVEMFLFDPRTGETFTEPRNDMDKTTIDACKGAIKLLGQEPFINKPCIAHQVCHEDKVKVLDKIKAEIEQITDTMGVSYNQYISKIDVLKIIDKYKSESEDNDEQS